MINTTTGQGTAKIYRFPDRTSRPTVASATTGGSNLQSIQIARGAFDGAWYHDVAVQDALRATKR